MAHERLLPELAEGDLVMLHDTGAYYSSAPCEYNSIPRPGATDPCTVTERSSRPRCGRRRRWRKWWRRAARPTGWRS
ncbi:hypothetical protein GCM10018784_78390 [Streptomyces hydrogenans]|nr:hypothetical protein GCM10018784_78390 [Streptomyces hydrogenans]